VSPVAKGRFEPSNLRGPEPVGGNHIADGGYYDNFGITVAEEWIKDVVQKYGNKLAKIIVVQIDAFPEDQQRAPALNPNGAWSSEVLGPVKTMLNARSATQLGRDRIELDLLSDDLANRTTSASSPESCPGFLNVINFDAHHVGPLSWQLSRSEIDDIQRDWTSQADQVISLKRCITGAAS